jgi:hypothetical protein
MYRVDLYIDGQKADLFDDESIEVNLTVQNIKDISKVFGDFSKGFNIPASPTNNAIFKHYYNVDIYGGFDANLRVDAFIEINNNVFRSGLIELESVQMKDNEPQSYQVGFYSNTTALKDLFGEDTLNDLDLSAYDHTHNDTNIEAGIAGYVAGTSDSVIYPMITPVTRWYYDSQGSHGDGNIHYHNDPSHGVFYYDLKPAIKLQKIIDAIEVKYGVTFNSDFFATTDFGRLFMWCHRRAGYMFKDQPNGKEADIIQFATNTTGDYNLTTQKYTITTEQETTLRVGYTITSSDKYRIQIYVNDALASSKPYDGNTTDYQYLGTLNVGDTVQIRLAPPVDWDGSVVSIGTITADVEYFYLSSWNTGDTVSKIGQSITTTVVIADQLPEQKVGDFLGSLIRQWNLVIVPTGPTTYDIEPLDTWLSEGTTREITQYINTEETIVKRPELYRRIEFKYNETEAILGEEYRLQNDIGYGDLRADFVYDGEEFAVEVGFDNMLFERLTDVYTGSGNVGLTEINVGQCVTREEEPYIGNPIIFYAPSTIRVALAYHWSYTEMGTNPSAIEKQDMWFISNVNNAVAADVTQTLNFGIEIDPYLQQGFNQSLYENYWKSYITGLYNSSRRVFVYKANLPLGIMTSLKMNDKLTILERNYLINNVSLNLQTGEATLELLNEV